MDQKQPPEEQALRFFATSPRPCGYLQGRDAISVFADPDARLSTAIYSELARFGFRRSGANIYVPACPGCSECVPVRIPVQAFRRSRNQQRLWNRNRGLEYAIVAAEFREDHFRLYQRYLDSRHPDGGMDQPSRDEYLGFLTSNWSDTVFLEFRLHGEPVAVAVTDRLDHALSAVYTFYEPSLARHSLGTYAILRQIEFACQQGADWLYLGYWISGSEKMRYKGRFRPLEVYRNGHWELIRAKPAM